VLSRHFFSIFIFVLVAVVVLGFSFFSSQKIDFKVRFFENTYFLVASDGI